MPFPLEPSDPTSLGLASGPLANLDRLINRHIGRAATPARRSR